MRVNYIRDGLTEEFHTFGFVQYSRLDEFCDKTRITCALAQNPYKQAF